MTGERNPREDGYTIWIYSFFFPYYFEWWMNSGSVFATLRSCLLVLNFVQIPGTYSGLQLILRITYSLHFFAILFIYVGCLLLCTFHFNIGNFLVRVTILYRIFFAFYIRVRMLAEQHVRSLLWPQICVVLTQILYCEKWKPKVSLNSWEITTLHSFWTTLCLNARFAIYNPINPLTNFLNSATIPALQVPQQCNHPSIATT